MTDDRDENYLTGLVRELCKLPKETEWVEFKHNNSNPKQIGEYTSALSNAAALNGKAFGYLVWGIEDETHNVVGTSFSPSTTKKGNEPLENWLLRLLTPKISFQFFEFKVKDKPVAMLEVARAHRHPVRFRGHDFIRIGEVKKCLKDAPERERALWRILDETPFEDMIAAERVDTAQVLRVLDYPTYFDLLDAPLPSSPEGILNALADDNLIQRNVSEAWDITNLGAVLFARKLNQFDHLQRKAMRVVQYDGVGRTNTKKEQKGIKGYASGFEGLVDYINGLLPANEVIEEALRKTVPMFPEIAIRELVANALIHQDFFVRGTGPMVEIFDDRIEITNPGKPLVDTQRFLDTPPKSRNEELASMMRRFGICEERGSGIDKVVTQVELFQLPAPLFEVPEGFTRAVLFAHKNFSDMDKEERIRACYLHACLQYVQREQMTNASLRKRFGVDKKNSAQISRVIGDTIDAGLVRRHDPESDSRRYAKYVPFWA